MTMERHLTRHSAMLDTLLSVRKGMIALLLAHLWTTTLLGVDYWQPITDPNLRAVVATEDRIVAVGDPGYVVTSTNGVDWHQCTVPTAGILTSVAYGNGKYLAVGGKGDAIHSDDGVNWKRTHLGVTNLLASVQFLGGQFVVNALEGIFSRRGTIYQHHILLSSNLVHWKTTTLISNSNDPMAYFESGIEVEGGYFFGGNSRNYAFTQDFVTWQKQPLLEGMATRVRKILHTPLGTLVAGNYVDNNDGWYTYHPRTSLSTNIAAWQWQSVYIRTNQALSGVAYGHGYFVSVGTGGVRLNFANLISRNMGHTAVSTNGLDWTYSRRPSGQDLYDVAFFKDHFIAVGHRGLILRSSDGTNWVEVQLMRSQLPRSFDHVSFGGGLFVGLGTNISYQSILTSTNGYWWDVQLTNAAHQCRASTYGSNCWVVIGEHGLILRSEDGRTWEPQVFPEDIRLDSIAYGSGVFVAISGNSTASKMFRSLDGRDWTSTTVAATNLSDITFAGGYFVAVGASNLAESTDGETWVTRSLPNTHYIPQIDFGDGLYVIGGLIAYSRDRTNWMYNVSAPWGVELSGNVVVHGTDGFISTGGRFINQSLNAIDWIRVGDYRPDYTSFYARSGAYGNERYVLVGTGSYFSRNLLPRLRITPTDTSASFRLNISTDPGLPFVVQSTESLDDPQWEDVPAISGTNAYESFEILRQGNGSRFYRAVPRF